jgi:hypothetical protein
MEHRTFVWQVRVAGQVRVHNPVLMFAVLLIPRALAPNAVVADPILKAAPAIGRQGTQGSRQGAVVLVQTVVIRLQRGRRLGVLRGALAAWPGRG